MNIKVPMIKRLKSFGHAGREKAAPQRFRTSADERATVDNDGAQRAAGRCSRGAPLIVGRKTLTSTELGSSALSNTSNNVIAARPTKAVFCIDNVGHSVTAKDVANFVTGMSVTVVSCFEVQPRKRGPYFDSERNDVKAFRLCIDSCHTERLLDATKWPAHIRVYEWYFKAKRSEQSETLHGSASPRIGSRGHDCSETTSVQPNSGQLTDTETHLKAHLVSTPFFESCDNPWPVSIVRNNINDSSVILAAAAIAAVDEAIMVGNVDDSIAIGLAGGVTTASATDTDDIDKTVIDADGSV